MISALKDATEFEEKKKRLEKKRQKILSSRKTEKLEQEKG